MSWLRYLPIPLALAALGLLAAAWPRPSCPDVAADEPLAALSQYPPIVPPARAPDPLALEALERALAALDPERVVWLETELWQRVRLPECSYEAEGRYLSAPGRRFRLELHTRQQGGASDLVQVGDGDALWQAMRRGQGPWAQATRVDLNKVQEHVEGSGSARLQAEFQQGPPTHGVVPLLRDLRQRLVWVRRAVVWVDGAECLELTGVWRPELTAALAPRGRPWPPGLASRCRLILDAESSWPRRVEWWGPGDAGATERIAEIEFRSPRLNEPLSEDRCDREFRFDPGKAEVKDRTDEFTAQLTARAAAP
jgi:hypothetical protein